MTINFNLMILNRFRIFLNWTTDFAFLTGHFWLLGNWKFVFGNWNCYVKINSKRSLNLKKAKFYRNTRMSIQRCNDQHDYSPVHRVTDVFGKIRFGIVSENAYLANHKQREASANKPVTISLEQLTNCLVSVQNIAYEFYKKNRGKWRSITITYGIFWWPSKYDKHTEGSINSTTDGMRLLITMIFSKQKRI